MPKHVIKAVSDRFYVLINYIYYSVGVQHFYIFPLHFLMYKQTGLI